MALNDIWLGPSGSEVLLNPIGRKYSEARVRLSRRDRTASGRLVEDVTALKRRFSLSYSEIEQTDLEEIATFYELCTTLSLLVRRPDFTIDTYTVNPLPFNQERVTSVGYGWWGNVVFEFEEV